MIKKRMLSFAAFLFLLLGLFLTGCRTQTLEESPYTDKDLNQLTDVTMEAAERSYPATVSAITLKIKNDSDEEYYYGVDFTVEKQEEGAWRMVPFKGEVSWIELAVILQPHSENEEDISFDLVKYNQEPGKYRIIKNIAGNPFAAEFVLTKE